MGRSASIGYSAGEAIGGGLSAYLQAKAQKDLREEQELQRRNIRALLAAYIDPKTELGSGAMAELMTNVSGIKAQPGQPFGLPPEPEPETYEQMLERERIEGYPKLSEAEQKEIKYKIKPAKEKEGVAAVDKISDVMPEKKPPTAAEMRANYNLAKKLINEKFDPDKELSQEQFKQWVRNITAQLEAGVRPEEVENPRISEKEPIVEEHWYGDKEIPQADTLFFPFAGEVETGKTAKPKSFHGATSYKSAIEGLKKNYQAGLIPEQRYREGLVEAKEFFGVK